MTEGVAAAYRLIMSSSVRKKTFLPDRGVRLLTITYY